MCSYSEEANLRLRRELPTSMGSSMAVKLGLDELGPMGKAG